MLLNPFWGLSSVPFRLAALQVAQKEGRAEGERAKAIASGKRSNKALPEPASGAARKPFPPLGKVPGHPGKVHCGNGSMVGLLADFVGTLKCRYVAVGKAERPGHSYKAGGVQEGPLKGAIGRL